MISIDCCLKRRRHLVLNDLDIDLVADDLRAVLDCLAAADIQTNAGVKLQRSSARRRLRVTEHDPDLFTQLVDEDRRAFAAVHHTAELSHRLGHHARLQTDLRIAHLAIQLCLRHQCRNRVDNDDVNAPRS